MDQMVKKIQLEEQVTEGVIIEFETKNPVFSLNTYKGTSFDELRLPETLRVVLELKDEEKLILFSRYLRQMSWVIMNTTDMVM